MTDRVISESGLRALLDEQEIRERLMQYCRGIDRVDAADVRSVYHDESWDDHGTLSMSGPDFAAIDRARLGPLMQNHHLGQCSIDIRGDVAFVETYFLAHARTRRGMLSNAAMMSGTSGVDPGELADPDEDVIALMTGRYVDRFDREDGAWRIRVRKVAMDWASEVPGPTDRTLFEAFSNGHHGQRMPDDLVYRTAEMRLP